MKTFTLIAGLTLVSTLSYAAPPADLPAERDLHAAQCVAALQVQTEDLAAQVKAGREEVRPMLLSRLESGTAFVGDTYLHGESDESKARALAKQALEAQKSLTEAQLRSRQDACAAEGSRLLADSNALERAVVKRLARKRMDRLLGA